MQSCISSSDGLSSSASSTSVSASCNKAVSSSPVAASARSRCWSPPAISMSRRTPIHRIPTFCIAGGQQDQREPRGRLRRRNTKQSNFRCGKDVAQPLIELRLQIVRAANHPAGFCQKERRASQVQALREIFREHCQIKRRRSKYAPGRIPRRGLRRSLRRSFDPFRNRGDDRKQSRKNFVRGSLRPRLHLRPICAIQLAQQPLTEQRVGARAVVFMHSRSEEHTSELQSQSNL